MSLHVGEEAAETKVRAVVSAKTIRIIGGKDTLARTVPS